MQNQSCFGGRLIVAPLVHLLLIPSTPMHLKLINNPLCYLTDQIIIREVQLKSCHTLIKKCSFNFFEQCRYCESIKAVNPKRNAYSLYSETAISHALKMPLPNPMSNFFKNFIDITPSSSFHAVPELASYETENYDVTFVWPGCASLTKQSANQKRGSKITTKTSCLCKSPRENPD